MLAKQYRFGPKVCKRAGGGADTIARGWKFNHWPNPQICEKHEPDRVELTLIIGSGTDSASRGNTTPITTPVTTPIEGKQTTREKIIQIIKSTPTISTSEIAVMCGITKDGAKYHLTKMKEQGVLKYSKDKGWIIDK